jgi:hypothetical protein
MQRFVLAQPAGISVGRNRITVAANLTNAGDDYTRWGSWHPYLGSRASRVPITLEVRTSARHQVIASGRQTSHDVADGYHTTRWRTNVPQGWMFLTVGDYRSLELSHEVPGFTVSWPRGDTAFDAAAAVRAPASMLSYFSEAFGQSGIAGFRLVEIPRDDVQRFSIDGLVVITQGSYQPIRQNPESLVALFAHELAHYWWGDLVVARGPGSPWLTEGLAEYSRALYERHAGTESIPWNYRNLLVLSEFGETSPPPLLAPDITLGKESIPYQKGAFVFRMLERELGGEQVLLSVLREVVERFRERPITLEDFQRVVNSRAPEPMDWFFAQWLERPTGPILSLDSVRVARAADGLHVNGTIAQVGPPYRLRIPLRIRLADSAVTRWIPVDGVRSNFDVRVDGEPRHVELDPSAEVFKWFRAADLPLDYQTVFRRVRDRGCAYLAPAVPDSALEAVRAEIARRFPGVVTGNSSCTTHILVGESAGAFRRQHLRSLPDPLPGDTRSFVQRGSGAEPRFVIGIEGPGAASVVTQLLPDAPFTAITVRNGRIVEMVGAALPRIVAALPPARPAP